MNAPVKTDKPIGLLTWVAVLGAFLIMAGLVRVMIHYTRPEPPTQARAEERRKNLQELRGAVAKETSEYAWVDQGKGIVRLPVERAMELTVQEWQDAKAGRAKLISRMEKATAAPPAAPAPVNPYL